MLSISEPLKGRGAANYYLREERADYYLSSGEPGGKWFGVGAFALGLGGTVKEADCRLLFSGFHPETKTPLTQNAGKDTRRQGWDLTFNAPKSVSALWSQLQSDSRNLLEACHTGAVKAAINHLEKKGVCRSGQGGKRHERCGLAFALFEHGTSRALEPHLHTHAVLFNVGVRRDGTTGTLETNGIFKEKLKAGHVYREELAENLKAVFGLEAEWKDTLFELRNVPKNICERFSSRRREIEKVLHEKGESSAKAAKVAAVLTRGKKTRANRDLLFEKWQEIGKEMEFGPGEAKSLIKDFVRHYEKSENAHEGREEKKSSQRSTWRPKPRSKVKTKDRPLYGRILLARKTIFANVTVQQKRVFPRAPDWSPASKLNAPVVRVTPKAWGKELVAKTAKALTPQQERKSSGASEGSHKTSQKSEQTQSR